MNDASFTANPPVSRPVFLGAGPAAPGRGRLPAGVAGQPARGAALAGLVVLVVDDVPDCCRLFRAILERAGAAVLTAESARSALTLIGQAQPDVMLSDIDMPDMNGYELLAAARQIWRRGGRHVPSAAVTANARPSDVQSSYAAGFEAHLAKPADAQCIVALVARLSGRL